VAWKRASEALKIAFMVKRNPRVLTMRDSSLGADVLVVGEQEPCGCMSENNTNNDHTLPHA
jgi:hypothetical protein